MLLPPADRWTEEAWCTLDEMWDFRRRPTPRPWFAFPAVRCLTMTSPAYAREIKGLPGLRPWNSFLVATAIGWKPGKESQTAVVIAPFEPDPEKWAGLGWRFAETGEPVPFDAPDNDGVRWSLRTLREFLERYAQRSIAEMLAPDGSPCGRYSRGVLRRRPIRDGERWLVLKEAAVWGDDPHHAFSAPQPETIPTGRAAASADWESKIKPALAVVGPAAVARRLGLEARTAQTWAAGKHQPSRPGEVARAIVAVAGEGGLGLPSDEHLRTEEICAALPDRAAAVQCTIAVAAGILVERYGGVRALARAMATPGGADLEPTVRRWLGLARSEPRPIGDLNCILSRLAKFSRAEIRKLRRRVTTGSGPLGNRRAVLAYLSLLCGAKRPVVPTPEEMIAFPVALVVVELLVPILSQIRFGRVGDETTVRKP
jgi:hypothetical protein